MKAPLYTTLVEYSREKKSFHMPGHKFGLFKALKLIDITALDATEVSGLDNLYEAEGVIKEAMKMMAEFYGAKETIFLTNGSTVGILASVLMLCKPGEKIIVARNCHHSVWSALILSGAIPIYVNADYNQNRDMIGAISPSHIEEALEKYPDIKGALIVSPTYEGVTSNIQEISNILHKKNKILIVDEAHGAHFIVHSIFPQTAVEQDADIVINSMHKTLPTLTQSGLLHLCSDRINKEEFMSNLKMVQTSSPSYAMMGIMDYIRGYIAENIEQIEIEYIIPLKKMRKELKGLKNLELLSSSEQKNDISKMIIMTEGTNINGYKLGSKLDKIYNIVVEAAFSNYIILITTIADNKKSLEDLKQALMNIDECLEKKANNLIKQDEENYKKNLTKISLGQSPREIYVSSHQKIELMQAKGKIAAKNVMLYPPGIPIIAVGEEITKEHLELIKSLQDKVIGLDKDKKYIEVASI